ncbi:alpha/beta hydrolase [Chromatiales bacterium (ex Bugula neritina AB1)]|nr:alpha/beta hydrolase [Chromatiales bacterium (ex Bugula neritina AB1)]
MEIDGATLEVASYGASPDQAATIVLLHEGLGCIELWRDFPKQLASATGYCVLAYSRHGYGNSAPPVQTRPLDYMSVEAFDVLPQLLDAVGIERCVLLGHSDGASIAALYTGGAADHRVCGLVLMAPHFFTEPMGIEAIENAKVAYESGRLKASLARYHQRPDTAFYGWCNAWLDPGFTDWNISDCIDYLRVPTLVIQGADDEYGTLEQIEVLQQRSYAPVDSLILDDCRHAPHLDQPQLTLRAITDYIGRLDQFENTVVHLPTR